ncbi:pirin-like bicupin family protein [Gordonia defluvii]|jgi:redox-sensitive bicupin YhaK (pirin superfamily)|uniref:Pirin-like bicupin family protein n=1 Tax=Gordonia defluvii TaxID=283718 RepID=A0ABN3YB95_9ACTN|nr:pirin family protein [Gordonia sp. UBA5067]
MGYSVYRARDRFTTTTSWLSSAHSFSFGDHYDPGNTHHGMLAVHNDEILRPGQGFDTHPHRETEIVTWVRSGSLVHQDSRGHSGIVYPGLAQRMSAGSGIEHSERNDTWTSGDGLRVEGAGRVDAGYVQMWVLPDEFGLDPGYDQADVGVELAAGGLIPIASGDPATDSAIRIANRSATLWVARLSRGRRVSLPRGRFTHLFVTEGVIGVGEESVGVGDAIRGIDMGGVEIVGTSDGAAEALVWVMDKTVGE